MALWICCTCGTAYSVGASKCPQCGRKGYRLEGEPEPEAKPAKVTAKGGITLPQMGAQETADE